MGDNDLPIDPVETTSEAPKAKKGKRGNTKPSGNGAATVPSKGRGAKRKQGKAKPPKDTAGDKKRKRTQRTYPAGPFSQVLKLGEAIVERAGERIRRLTLLELLEMSPTSSTTQVLITTSNKYGITQGSFVAEWLELTPLGKLACDSTTNARLRLEAKFKLAIEGVGPFKALYDEYVGKRLPAPAVMSDLLNSKPELGVNDTSECIDIFIVNVKDLGLLRTIAAAETLIPIDQALDEIGNKPPIPPAPGGGLVHVSVSGGATDWSTICFYVSPIGDAESVARKHSDLFKSSIIEPAMKELGLRVVRADETDNAGMIATGIIQHLRHSKLVIADLSMLNPNVFYEIGLRHACRMPIVQIIQRSDKLPFDINQVNTIQIDNTDLYSFVPRIETFRAEVAALARRAIESPEAVSNPITAFYPAYWNS